MPGKSRRNRRGKYAIQSRRGNTASQALSSPRPEAVQTEPALAKSPGAAFEPIAQVPVRHPYINAELRSIGILAVVMIAILIGLALALS